MCQVLLTKSIDIEIRIVLCNFLCFTQFCTNISRQVFTCCLIGIFGMGNFENFAHKVMLQLVLGHTRQTAHVLKVNPCFLRNGERECFKCRINVFHSLWRYDTTVFQLVECFCKEEIVQFRCIVDSICEALISTPTLKSGNRPYSMNIK